MDLLAIEAFSWTPHLETAAEICVTEAQAGRSVGFAFVPLDNPDERRQLWRRALTLVAGPRHKVARLAPLLQAQGVTPITPSRLPAAARRAVNDFATQHVGTIDDLRRLSYKGGSLGLGVASSLISRTGDPAPDVARFETLVARYLRASALVFESACALIARHQPQAVLVFNGRFACSKGIAEAARHLKVRCLFHERGATFQRYMVYDAPIHGIDDERQRILDVWASAPRDREDVGRAFFKLRRQGEGIGWMSYTGDQRAGVVPARRKPRRYVYFHSNDDELALVEDVVPHSCFESQRHAIEFLVRWVGRQLDAELIIRLHPSLQAKSDAEQTYWRTVAGANAAVELPGSQTDSYALAESADVVLTYGSTMGVEAAFLGKPVILLCDASYGGLGCVYEPATAEELLGLLNQPMLPPKPAERCLPYGYYALTYGTPYRFYQPTSLFSGSFMGVELAMSAKYLRRFRTSGLGRSLSKAPDTLRGR